MVPLEVIYPNHKQIWAQNFYDNGYASIDFNFKLIYIHVYIYIYVVYINIYTVQPHYNTPYNNAVFEITWPYHGCQIDFFLLYIYCK